MRHLRFRRAAAILLAGTGLAALSPVLQPVLAPAGLAPVRAAAAQGADATSFVRSLGDRLVSVVNSDSSTAEKKTQIQPLIDQNVDVDGIGRFCLGRFWRTATPAQQQRYLALFHKVLVNSITGKLGEYRGVTFQVGQAHDQDGKTMVPTVINRPNQPSATVEWVVGDVAGGRRITDVVAEGVSLSLTQRSDYASFLQRHGNNVDTLLNALDRQVSRQAT
ncbi:MlaC/ttg2D family ABC transporter substrate-binding protein [Rhizosaccharibacter radicis]|uniref:ABC transporter substrate-binding protein n=1 Tax=Rhizosaccharibacter radicis TaxID=2782605 RepID=A0ABT1VTI7_9PROT|nr:ABC transporter substrate-binding protein [Acetobacteraceae bacterium KSS12]